MAKVLPDEYTMRARLAPALTALFPVAVVVLIAFPSVQTWWEKALTFVLSIGLWVAPASWVGDQGRAREAGLWQNWGGAPTTAALRWRTATNKTLIATRHASVARATGVALPDQAAETQDPTGADEQYEAAVEVLKEATRDKERFSMVFEANKDYGFRRNCYGLRPIALLITAIASLAAAASVVVGLASSAVSWRWATAALIINVICMLWWWRGVNPEAVRAAGDRYAERLLAGASQVPDAPATEPREN